MRFLLLYRKQHAIISCNERTNQRRKIPTTQHYENLPMTKQEIHGPQCSFPSTRFERARFTFSNSTTDFSQILRTLKSANYDDDTTSFLFYLNLSPSCLLVLIPSKLMQSFLSTFRPLIPPGHCITNNSTNGFLQISTSLTSHFTNDTHLGGNILYFVFLVQCVCVPSFFAFSRAAPYPLLSYPRTNTTIMDTQRAYAQLTLPLPTLYLLLSYPPADFCFLLLQGQAPGLWMVWEAFWTWRHMDWEGWMTRVVRPGEGMRGVMVAVHSRTTEEQGGIRPTYSVY